MKAAQVICLVFYTCILNQSILGREITKVEEKSFDLKAGSTVTLINDEGSIKVNSWGKDEVYLKMTKRVWHRDQERAKEIMDRLDVEIEQTGNRLYIREIDIRHRDRLTFWDLFEHNNWQNRAGYQIDFEVTLPRNINLKIENDEGDVDVAEISGQLRLTVDEGNVHLSDLNLVNIDIELDEGDVELVLPEDIEAQFRVESRERRIRSEFPVSIRRFREEGEYLRETLGDGVLRINVFSEHGNIFLKKY